MTKSTTIPDRVAFEGKAARNTCSADRAPSTAGVVGLIPCAAAGSLSMGIAPFIVTGLSTYSSLSTSRAGLCVSAEMAGEVAAAAYMLLLLKGAGLRRLTVAALALVIAGNLACLAASGFPTYMATRLIAGLGCGLTLVAYGPIAATRTPERNFALLNCANILLAAACGACAPWLFAIGGVKALFAAIALAAGAALLLCTGIARDLAFAGAESLPIETDRISRRTQALLASSMNFFYFTALGAFWAYVSEIGVATGDGSRFTATTIALSYLSAGLLGSLTASAVASRVKPKMIVCLSAISTAVCVQAVTLIPGHVVFALAVSVFIFSWFLVYPFFMGILSALDKSGRLVVLNVLIQISGFVVGPAIGGLAMRAHRFGAFGALCVMALMVALACALTIKTAMPVTQNRGHQ